MELVNQVLEDQKGRRGAQRRNAGIVVWAAAFTPRDERTEGRV